MGFSVNEGGSKVHSGLDVKMSWGLSFFGGVGGGGTEFLFWGVGD